MMALSDISDYTLAKSLRKGRFSLSLGPFVIQLQTENRAARSFLKDMYRNCLADPKGQSLADFSLNIRPPNLIRKYIRRQITPDPGFYFPTVPLPPHMGALALEMGMNLTVALQCFRYSIFHAGVVASDKGAIVIAAHSGGGKSTLTAALMEEGMRLLSDEFAVMQLDDARLMPYPRPVSLKNESVSVVREFAGAEAMSAVLTGTPKGEVGYRRARQSDIAAMHQSVEAKILLFPRFKKGEQPSVNKVEKGDALSRFIAGSPNYHIIGEAAFNRLMDFSETIEAYELTYGSTEDSLKLVADLRAEHGI